LLSNIRPKDRGAFRRTGVDGTADWHQRRRRPNILCPMIRIVITRAAFDAIAATHALGSVAVELEANERGQRLIWLEEAWVDRLHSLRGPGESYSDVILRIAAAG
jgi:hypothetical protein